MEPNQFKQCKNPKIDAALTNYIQNVYGDSSVTEGVQNFINNFQESKNSLSNLVNAASTGELKSYKNLLINYVIQLKLVQAKLLLTKSDYKLKAEFNWTDTIKQSAISQVINTITKKTPSSDNFYFEYFNVLYNLGVDLYKLSDHLEKEQVLKEESDLKEISKNYQYAINLFETIKNEIKDKLSPKDLTLSDLSDENLDLSISLCKAKAQIILLEIADKKKLQNILKSQLCHGISLLFSNIHHLTDNPIISKGADSNLKLYFRYMTVYYDAKMYLYLRDINLDKFNETGKNYGESLVYERKAVNLLKKVSENVMKFSNYFNVTKFNEEYQKETDELAKMEHNNLAIYHCNVPNLDNETYESKIMVQGQPMPELSDEKVEESEFANMLIDLVPPEVKALVDQYNQRMQEYVNSKVELEQNEFKISEFIFSLELPQAVVSGSNIKNKNSYVIDDGLWQRIQSIQSKNVTSGLLGLTETNLQKNFEYEKKLKEIYSFIDREEREDNYYRQQLGNKWVRDPSGPKNAGYKNYIIQAVNSLNKSRPFDQQARQGILSLGNKYDVLTHTREQITNELPGNKEENIPKKLTKEQTEIKSVIDELFSLGKQCQEFKDNCLNSIQNEKIDSVLYGVIRGDCTMESVIEKFTPQVDEVIGKYSEHSKNIMNKEMELQNLLQKLENNSEEALRKREIQKKNFDFMNEIELLIRDYINKYDKLVQGFNYYKGIFQKMDNLIDSASDFVNRRNQEKQYLLKTSCGKHVEIQLLPTRANKGYYGNEGRINDPGFVNPNLNTITNMNIHYQYRPDAREQKYLNNNNQRNMMNMNMNNNNMNNNMNNCNNSQMNNNMNNFNNNMNNCNNNFNTNMTNNMNNLNNNMSNNMNNCNISFNNNMNNNNNFNEMNNNPFGDNNNNFSFPGSNDNQPNNFSK